MISSLSKQYTDAKGLALATFCARMSQSISLAGSGSDPVRQLLIINLMNFLNYFGSFLKNASCTLIDTGEDSELVHRRKRPNVNTLFSSLFFPTRPSDENTSVHFWAFSIVSVTGFILSLFGDNFRYVTLIAEKYAEWQIGPLRVKIFINILLMMYS